NLACSDFVNSSEGFKRNDFETALGQFKTADCSLSCEQDELKSVGDQLSCVKQQGNLLAQQLSTLKTVYQNNSQRFQQDIQAYKQRVADRQTQIDFVTNTLVGTPTKPGLIPLQTEMQTVVNQSLPAEINKVTQQATNIAQQAQMIQEQINQRQLALMNQCFAS